MRTVLNVVWLLLAGLELAIAYAIAGLICCILIVTIPWGIASFRIAGYVLWPFGREITRRADAGLGSALGNIVWFVFAGWWLAIGHVVTAFLLAITIIGLPLAWANLKLIPITLTPLGRQIVDTHRPFAS
ncbi:YccF domain-containing protein [Ruania albidiflava]|uniref:YccF domain-containing protein n=1 Tax=Ruania albidiflava TaxID=366586 RepID=UPI0003B4F747|nr:YccF domain-containing protein [Ruania albidiflava]